MIRRLVAVSAAALCAFSALPAHAAAPVKLYLNQLADDCGPGGDYAITTKADDAGHGCIIVDRVLVEGNGFTASESFVSRKLKTYTLDASKAVTGTFVVYGSAVVADGFANVSIDFTVKVAKKKIGVVHIEGLASPTTPLTKTFSLKLPSALNKVKTNSVSVTTEWTNNVGLSYVGVSGSSFLNLPVR